MMLKGLSGKSYQLAEKPFSSGGEGSIYSIASMPGGVAKVYHPGRVTKELEEKLLVMYRHPPNREIFAQIAWPVDVLYDAAGAFRGFVMLRLNITDELGAIYAYPPKKNISYRAKLVIAQNICAVISEIHKAGFVFGDFNPKNIGIDLGTCRVAFLDTDSYHVVDGSRTYRCKVCLDGYVAPELLKKCEPYKTDAYAQAPLPTFTRETDNFALAIHIFRLLMNGYTPFNGIRENDNVSTASPGTGNQAIKRDSYCFKPGNRPQSVAVPPLSALPGEIADLFTRAFMYGRIDPAQRPTASEWYQALLNYENSLVPCPNNNAHMYQKGLTTCPWCAADNRYNALMEEPSPRAPAGPPIPQKTFSGAVVPVPPPVTVPKPPSVTAPPPPAPPPVSVPKQPVGGGHWPPLYGTVSPPPTGYGAPGSNPLGQNRIPPAGAPHPPNRPADGARSKPKHFRRRRLPKLLGALATILATVGALFVALLVINHFVRTPTSEEKYGLSKEQYIPLGELECSEEYCTGIEEKEKKVAFGYSTYQSSSTSSNRPRDNFGTWYEDIITGLGKDNMAKYPETYNEAEAWREYRLDGSYGQLRGRVILVYHNRTVNYSESCLRIFGDGVVVYRSEPVTAGCEVQDFTVDISKFSTLKIHIQGCMLLGLVDCGLYQDASVPTVSTAKEADIFSKPQALLGELPVFNTTGKDGWISDRGKTTDNWGTDYSTGITLFTSEESKEAGEEMWSEFRLNGRYRNIQGKVVLNGEYQDAVPENVYFAIYGDGKLLYRSPPLAPGYEPQAFDLDISGVTALRVASTDRTNQVLRVVDCVLSKQAS